MKYVSLMVPVYNEQDNIENLIQHLQHQTCQRFEIVFVNDGSKDNSWSVLIAMVEKYPKMDIKIINQYNQGASGARKTAALHAKYDYVAYLDCDDKLSDDAIQNLLEAVEDDELDIAAYRTKIEYKLSDGTKEFRELDYFSNEKYLTGQDCFLNMLHDFKMSGACLVRKDIFLKSYDLYQQYNPTFENYVNNDEIIARLSYFLSKKVVMTDAIYYLCYNEKSTTKGINPNYHKILHNQKILYDLAKNTTQPITIRQLSSHLKFMMNRYKEQKGLIHNKHEWIYNFYEFWLFTKKKSNGKMQLKLLRLYFKIWYLDITKNV